MKTKKKTCTPSCFGMAITSLNKYEPPKDLEKILKSASLDAYKKFKRMFSLSGSYLKRKIRTTSVPFLPRQFYTFSLCTKK